MRTILTQHARRYGSWAVADLYKLLHQAANGSGHVLDDEARARQWLKQEVAQPGPGPEEPLIDFISPDGRYVRVHLRPFTIRRLNEEMLLQAFILTGKMFLPAFDRLISYAAVAHQLAQEGVLPFDAGEISSYIGDMQAAGFPAVHHSARYTQQYRPAYRVVAHALLPSEIVEAAQHGV